MTIRQKFGAIVLVILTFIGAYLWGKKDSAAVFRYRITIEVDTPGGLRSGSSVFEARTVDQWPIMMERRSHTETRGEAVFVDLGQGRSLVGLIAFRADDWNPNLELIVGRTFLGASDLQGSIGFIGFAEDAERLAPGRLVELPPKNQLVMMLLHNTSDPRSARPISSGSTDLARELGPGHAVRRMTIEMVLRTEPLSFTIEQKIPWLSRENNGTPIAIRQMRPTARIDNSATYNNYFSMR